MLSTAEVTAAFAARPELAESVTTAEFLADKAERDALETEWKVWLADKYLSGYSTASAELVYQRALGRAQGYDFAGVETFYADLAKFVIEIGDNEKTDSE